MNQPTSLVFGWMGSVFCFLFRFLFFVSQRRQIDKTSSWLHPSRGWGVREGALVLAFLNVLFSFFSSVLSSMG